MFRRLTIFAAALLLGITGAMAQVRVGLMVSATGPTTAIGIPRPTNHNGMDERARVLVIVRDGRFRLLPE